MNFLVRRTLPAVMLILLAGILIYSNTFETPFVFDDQHSIVQNKVIQHPGNVFHGYQLGLKFVQYRLIAFLSFALNYHFGGLDVTGYHLVNLTIHLLSALLVYALLRLSFQTPFCSCTARDKTIALSFAHAEYFVPLFAALLFVVHPVQTQAVTYIVQRMASLTTLFYLLSLVLYVKARLQLEEKSGGPTRLFLYYAGAVIAALLAMKTKEIAFTLPMAVVLYELFFFQGALLRRLLYTVPLLATLPIIPLTILGLLDVGIDEKVAEEWRTPQEEPLRVQTSISRLDYLFTQFRVIVTYLRLLILPIRQNIDYDYPIFKSFFTPAVYLSFALLVAMVILAGVLFFLSRQKSSGEGKESAPEQRLMAFGIIWFFLTLAVESSLIPIKDLIMEHRLYLPFFGAATTFSAFLFLLITKLTSQHSGKILIALASILILVLGVATYQRNLVWGEALRLWQDTAEKSPNKARPLNNLGKELEDAGKRDEAIAAFTRAIKADPAYYKAYYNLADLYLVSDQPETALKLLQAAINIYPQFTDAYVSVGAALMRAGRFPQVAAFLEQNLDRVAEIAEARFYLGAAYVFLGKRKEALRELAALDRLDESYADDLRRMMGMKSGHSQ